MHALTLRKLLLWPGLPVGARPSVAAAAAAAAAVVVVVEAVLPSAVAPAAPVAPAPRPGPGPGPGAAEAEADETEAPGYTAAEVLASLRPLVLLAAPPRFASPACCSGLEKPLRDDVPSYESCR